MICPFNYLRSPLGYCTYDPMRNLFIYNAYIYLIYVGGMYILDCKQVRRIDHHFMSLASQVKHTAVLMC